MSFIVYSVVRSPSGWAVRHDGDTPEEFLTHDEARDHALDRAGADLVAGLAATVDDPEADAPPPPRSWAPRFIN